MYAFDDQTMMCGYYGRFASVSPSSSSSSSDCESEYENIAPSVLLMLAISKRRAACSQPKRDLRIELLHTCFVKALCKQIGEGRARRHRKRRGGKRRSRSRRSCSKETLCTTRECSDNKQENAATWRVGCDFECSEGGGYSDCCTVSKDNFVQSCETSVEDDSGDVPSVPHKRARVVDNVSNIESDPFGLDAIFAEVYGGTAYGSEGRSGQPIMECDKGLVEVA